MAFRKKFKGTVRKYATKQNAVKAYKFGKKHQGTAVKAYKLAKKIARMVNVEYKFINNVRGNLLNAKDGIIWRLDEVDQGTSENERNGNGIKLIRLSGRVALKLGPAVTEGCIRMILFRGKNENTEAYEPGRLADAKRGILNDVASGLYLARKEEDNMYDTKFLFDKTYTLSEGSSRMKILNWDFKLYGHVNYTDNANTVENGGLYLMVIGDDDDSINYSYTLKTSFVDN